MRKVKKVVMYIQKLHGFCYTSSPDDGPKSGRKYYNKLWKVYQPTSAEHHEIRKD